MTNEKKRMTDLPQTAEDVPTVEVTKKYLNALRQAVGLQIDPETADVEWIYAQTLDPYGDDPDLPEEYKQVGREYFARSPGSDVWVSFDDLPEATRTKLWEKHKSKLAFPGRTFRRGLKNDLAIFLAHRRRDISASARAGCCAAHTERSCLKSRSTRYPGHALVQWIKGRQRRSTNEQ